MPESGLAPFLSDLRRAYRPGMAGQYLGQGAPLLDTGRLQDQLMQLFNLSGEVFSPEGWRDIASRFKETGTRDIASQSAAAKRGIGSRLAASGMSDSFVATQAPLAVDEQAARSLSNLQAKVPEIEMGYKSNLLQSMLQRAGILGQIGSLQQADYGSAMTGWQAGRSGFPSLLNALIQYYSLS